MFRKDKSVRDGFTFSLGGTTVINSVVAAPVVDGDRLNQQCRAHFDRAQDKTARRKAWFGVWRIPA